MSFADAPSSTPASAPATCFIGGGNMARSLIGGLIGSGVPAGRIVASAPGAGTRAALARDYGVRTHEDNRDAAREAATWVLAVKPQRMREVCAELRDAALATRPLVVSVAAGITSAQLDRWLGGGQRIVRVMPNTPALLGAGASGLFAVPAVDDDGRAQAEALVAATGSVAWIADEAQMDVVTALSGSGPAYFFLLAEAMIDAGIEAGLDADTARGLVTHTALGAARMLTETGDDAASLRTRVTSPGGTTQAALETFEAAGLRAIVADAVRAAARRGAELAADNG